MVLYPFDFNTRLGRYDYVLEEEEERRKLMQKIKKLEQEIEKLKATKKESRIIDVDSDCEIWS